MSAATLVSARVIVSLLVVWGGPSQYIYRITAGYLVSAWLILQIAALLCSALGLPNWILKALLDLLLVGCGACLIIGWRIDLRVARLTVASRRGRT